MSPRGLIAVSFLALAGAAQADQWRMSLTADNQFALYVGDAAQTNAYVGAANYWGFTYAFTFPGGPGTDVVYVVSASDRAGAQGLIGAFTNESVNRTILTGADWEVFPAGAYAATNPNWPSEWPANVMPTRAQVDAAIAYGTGNHLWVPAVTVPGYTNGVAPWGTRPDIPAAAAWIWHDSGRNGPAPSPLIGSFNHDEFLIFRASANRACDANCDGSTTQPVLNVNDFICFSQRFAAGDPRANCDRSTTPPTLNVNDFVCFQTQFAAGCP
jgi:hypothetical protein